MADLSNWDFALTFSGIQAALLILGIDPTNAGHGQDDRKIVPVIQRMKTDYKGALGASVWARDLQDSPKGNLPDPMQGPKNLYSLKMFDPQGYEYNLDRLKEGHWLSDEEATKFDNQQFPRNEIARWLGATGMSSVYKFGVESKHDRPAGPRWPWGDHHTKRLGHLEAAAREFWDNYDPQNPKGTAPKNEVVAAWLMERGVPNSMATAMATILRPDGLKSGPRK